jgi:hypothetical protein
MGIKRPELLDEFTRRFLQSVSPLSQRAPDTRAPKREVKPRPLPRYKPASRHSLTRLVPDGRQNSRIVRAENG